MPANPPDPSPTPRTSPRAARRRARANCWRRRSTCSSKRAMPPPGSRRWPGAPACPRARCSCISPARKNCSRPWCARTSPCRFPQWSIVLDQFPGTTRRTAALRHAASGGRMVGDTKASGISKLMMSEASNFPELAAFYQHEVIEPGNALIRRILQRGIDTRRIPADGPAIRRAHRAGADAVPGGLETLVRRLHAAGQPAGARRTIWQHRSTSCSTACASPDADTTTDLRRPSP